MTVENNSLRFESKSLLGKLEGLEGAHLTAIDEKNGDYSISVKSYSASYVLDLLNTHLGRDNYKIKFDVPKVMWTYTFNIYRKGRTEAVL